ncbi:MAG: hypothetical protein MJ193_05065 [Clostridia bacterium]|nr:hypothetical protein [Clostridia bacterium]
MAGVALNPKTDYKVIYENNVEIGTATAIILPSGFGAEKWTGQKEVTFNIIANPDADTNDDHINAKLVTANAGFEGKDFAVVENWKNSGAVFKFEYKKLTVTEPTSGNSARFSLMDVHNGWIRLSQHLTLNFSTNKVTCGGAEVGTIEDIGDDWYRFSIALADVPMNDSAGEVATGTETLKLVYFDNITRAFKLDNLTAE